MEDLKIVYLSPYDLKPYENNTRKHTPEDIDGIKTSILHDGFNDPIGIWGEENLIVANLADIAVFDNLRRMTDGRYLWIRNNAATILCNCVENFGFIFLAFYGMYSAAQCAEIAIATSVIEIVAAVCDTPFAYLGRKFARAEGD